MLLFLEDAAKYVVLTKSICYDQLLIIGSGKSVLRKRRMCVVPGEALCGGLCFGSQVWFPTQEADPAPWALREVAVGWAAFPLDGPVCQLHTVPRGGLGVCDAVMKGCCVVLQPRGEVNRRVLKDSSPTLVMPFRT